MAVSLREEIPNGHIPLAFLLGRRASEYSLPSLRNASSWKAPHLSSVFSAGAHVRQREQQARALLERVLAREVRVDPKNKADHDTALAPPLMRVSSADRRRRAAELRRVLDENGEECDCSAATVKEIEPSGASVDVEPMTEDLYQQRERFAQYHGYAPSEPDFVEVVGHRERIKRTQSLRQLHDDDKRKRVKQLKAKQSRVESLRRQLQQQQVETKQKLQQAEQRLRGPAPESSEEVEEEHQVEETLRSNRAKHKAHGKTEAKVRGRLEEEEEKARIARKLETQERHESVQRSRQERQSLRQQRRATHEYDKKLMVKLAGSGPSFQSTLRMEDPATSSQLNDGTGSCSLLPLEQLAALTCDDTVDDTQRSALAARLQERQHEAFISSRTRSLQFGGGFGSKPRSSLSDEAMMPNAREEESDCLATNATAIGVVKSKREIVADWKTTLATLGHRR